MTRQPCCGPPLRLVSAEIDPVYDPMFRVPETNGWLGSDVVYSIPLSAEKSIWIFADTWLGRIEDGKRVQEGPFIHSSIAIQDRTGPAPGKVEFFWNKEKEWDRSLFPDRLVASRESETLLDLEVHTKHELMDQVEKPHMFHWPTMGMLLGGELFVYAYRLEMHDFSHVDMPTTLLRVPNPHDPPDLWKTQVFDLGLGGNEMSFHTAIHVDGPYVYFIGYAKPVDPKSKDSRAVLGRAKTADILTGGLAEAYEFWVEGTNGPEWGPTPENLVTLFSPGNTEAGIHYEPEWGLYFCTTYRGATPEIYVTAAPELTGPWCEPFCVYRAPEHDAVSFPIISYAARPHPELSTKPGELIISYATNAPGDIKALFTKEGLQIYYPRFVRVQLERNG